MKEKKRLLILPDSVENSSIEQNGLRETQAVSLGNSSRFPEAHKQFPRETPSTNTKNSILRTKDITPLTPQRGERGEWDDEIESLTSAFPESSTENLPEKMELWAKEYGAETLRAELASILNWRQGKGKSKKYRILSQFVGNWLRRSCVENVAAEHFDNTFWPCWPGSKEGREGARKVWIDRFAKLASNKERARALLVVERQLNDLIDEVDSGEREQRFVGKAKNWIWDADFNGEP